MAPTVQGGVYVTEGLFHAAFKLCSMHRIVR